MMNRIQADHDELVFRHRNQSYGSYVLRKALPRETARAFVISVVSVGALLLLPALRTAWSEPLPMDDRMVEDVVLHDVPLPNEPEPLPEPEVFRAEAPAPPRRDQVQFVSPEVVETSAITDPTETFTDAAQHPDAEIGQQTLEGTGETGSDIPDLPEFGTGNGNEGLTTALAPTEPGESAFVNVDSDATAVNLAELRDLIQYPQMAMEMGIKGRVTVRVLVNTRGEYVRHVVKRSPHPWLTAAVEEHLPKLRFTPAIYNSQPVMVWVNVPFNFQ
jgi:protein TonB